MKRIYLIGLFALSLMPLACKKAGLIAYDNGSRISIYKDGIADGRDSLLRSFAVMKEEVLSDTVELPLRIVGPKTAHEREVAVRVNPEKSSLGSSDYEILKSVVPTDSYEGILEVKINRSAAMKEKDARIWLELQDSKDFEVGPKELASYLIKVNDYLTKPASWQDVRFGEYSQTKYSLIIRETGYSDFTAMHPEVFMFIVGKCNNVLRKYLAENGYEMLDENKVPVRFP